MDQQREKNFVQRLREKPLLADGAMGTLLYARGASVDECLEALSIERPQWIGAIHQAYARAGADLLTTHTFGANRLRLAHYGLASKVSEFNTAAVRLACEARDESGRAMFVAGNVGPVGKRIDWDNALERIAVVDAFREQICVLSRAGVDLLLFETFSDVMELEVAVQVAKELCHLPLIASMSYGSDGRTLAGQPASAVTRRLLVAGVDVVGVNCSIGAAQVVQTLRAMHESAPDALFSAMPNAGLPVNIEKQLRYPESPQIFADHVPLFLSLGARLVGGCCGTTPLHISAMRSALESA